MTIALRIPNNPQPEKNLFAIVVQVRANTHNAITGRSASTVWSIQNPSGTYWVNRRGRRRAWNSREAADAARYNETGKPVPPPVPKSGPAFPTGPSAFGPIPPPPRPAPPVATHIGPTAPDGPVPLDVDNPDGERVGKLVAAAIAIDPRIARKVMDVISSMIRTA